MSTASTLLTSFVLIAGAAAAGAFYVAQQGKFGRGGAAPKVKKKPLLTANELEFLDRLEAAVPELRFCPQVAMGALLQPAVTGGGGKSAYALRAAYSQKIVDYAVLRRSDGEVSSH